MPNDDLPNWVSALYDVLRRSRAVPRLIILPRAPGAALSRSLPLVVVIAMIASALYDLGRAETINFVLAATLTTGLGVAVAWVLSLRPHTSDSALLLVLYRWLYMLVAVFVGALLLFLAEVILAHLVGWNPPVYGFASDIWAGQTDLYDKARLLQFFIYAVVAWSFYAAFFRPPLPSGEPLPRGRETLLAGVVASVVVAFTCALLLQFGVDKVIGWMGGLTDFAEATDPS